MARPGHVKERPVASGLVAFASQRLRVERIDARCRETQRRRCVADVQEGILARPCWEVGGDAREEWRTAVSYNTSKS